MATRPQPVLDDWPAAPGGSPSDSYTPTGFKSQEEFLTDCRRLYKEGREADKDNLDAALDDLKFVAGEQWNKTELANRETLGKPSLTINVLPQSIGQVVGDRRVNQVAIKVVATEDDDTDIAEIRSDLIRAIEGKSRADRVYARAFENMVSCGIGWLRVDLDYVSDDVFERDIRINPIENPLSVTIDPMAGDPTGADARYCFIEDEMPLSRFKERWPDVVDAPDIGDSLLTECRAGGWMDGQTVRVTEFWRMVDRPATLALMTDGSVVDVQGKSPAEFAGRLWLDHNHMPKLRETRLRSAQMHLITGHRILEGPYDLPVNRLPVIRAEGRVVYVGGKRARFGLVRFAKDPQRLKNYWRSVAAELLSKAPRQQWYGPDDAFEGYEKDFRDAHLSADPILKYSRNASNPPQMVPPVQIPQAILNEAAMAAQDIKDVTGIHDASLGIRSNETSGRAINARQREGDIAAIIYHDNMNAAVQECGDLVNQLIPVTYDTARTLRVVGAEQEERLIRINDPMNPESVDLAKGKYDVTIATGPAYMTKRIEAAQSMMEAVQSWPQFMEIAGDKVAQAQDWPGADEIAERFKRSIPPQLLGPDERAEREKDGGRQGPQIPPELQQQIQEGMQLIQQLQAENAELKGDKANEGRKLDIDAYGRETDRLKAVGDMAKLGLLSPEDLAVLQQTAMESVQQVMASPDVLPPEQMPQTEGFQPNG